VSPNVSPIPDAERYHRQMLLEGFGPEGQARLAAARVVVAGTGGLGCPLSLYLAAAGVGRILLVDMDVVAPSNLNRQILHWEQDLGRPKVESAAEKLRCLNANVRVDISRSTLTEATVDGIIDGSDVVLDALDNFAARRLLNRACLRQGIPFIYGGIHGLTGMLSTLVPGKTACLECLFQAEGPSGVFPVLGTTPGVVACLQATEAVKLVVGLGRPLFNRLLVYEGLDMSFQDLPIRRNPACPACAGVDPAS